MTTKTVDRSLPDPVEEPTITVKRYAQIMGIGLRNTYNLMDQGDVPYIQLGHRRVIPTKRALKALYE